MRDRLAEFGAARVAVVAFTPPERLAAYRNHLALPASMALVSDPDRTLYAALGAQRGRRRQVWSIGTLQLYATLLRQGRRLQRATEDVRQLGADAVVGRDGAVRYLALPVSPDARPPIDELIAALD